MNKMQSKNLFIMCLLTLMSTLSIKNAYAQNTPPKPAACTTAPPGFIRGGTFTVSSSRCSEPDDPNREVAVRYLDDGVVPAFPSSVQYVYDFSDDIDITAAGFTGEYAAFTGGSWNSSKILTPGGHWVLQIAEINGQKYISCGPRAAEVIRVDPPVANIFSCDGTSVTIKIEENEANKHNRYKIEWGDGTEKIVDVSTGTLPFEETHTYSGVLARIAVTGSYIRNNYEICVTNPEIKDPNVINTPIINGLTSSNGGANISFKNFSSDGVFTVQVAEDLGSNYTWSNQGVATSDTYAVTGLKEDSKYCYRVLTLDPCGNEVPSNIVCDLTLSATQSSSSDATIRWVLPSNPSGTPQQLELLKDVEGCDDCLNSLPLFSNLDDYFEDLNLECSEVYNYQVTARYAIEINGNTEFVTIASDKLDVDPLTGSTKIIPNGLIQATYMGNDDSAIKLVVLDQSDISQYHFFHKSPSDADFVSIGKSTGNTFTDIAVIPSSGKYCYKYQLEDACGIKSDLSPEFCTVFLSYEGNTLNWTDFTFPNTIITSTDAKYTIESYNEDFGAFLPEFWTNDLTKGVGYLISNATEPTIKFRITAQQVVESQYLTDYAIVSYSNTVEMPIPADIFIPSAFSPNGDGENERYEIKSKFVESGTITIFDRWGSILYKDDLDGRGWDGTSPKSNEPVPSGNYTYKISGISLAGEAFSRNGILTLLK